MKKAGKGFLIASGVIDIIMGILLILGGALLTLASFTMQGIIQAIDETGLNTLGTGILIFVSLVIILMGVLFLVFGIMCVRMPGKETEIYLRLRGKVLAYAIVETVFLFLSVLGSVQTKYETTTTLVGMIISIVLFATMVGMKYAAYGMMVTEAKKNLDKPKEE